MAKDTFESPVDMLSGDLLLHSLKCIGKLISKRYNQASTTTVYGRTEISNKGSAGVGRWNSTLCRTGVWSL